jgi:hypothetical protein
MVLPHPDFDSPECDMGREEIMKGDFAKAKRRLGQDFRTIRIVGNGDKDYD